MSSSTLSSYSNRSKPMSGLALAFLAALAVGLALFYRLPDLGLRPMHTDEANLGVKFIDMCKQGRFDYDPHDFHGPVLHYATWVYGTLAGWGDSMAITEADLLPTQSEGALAEQEREPRRRSHRRRPRRA